MDDALAEFDAELRALESATAPAAAAAPRIIAAPPKVISAAPVMRGAATSSASTSEPGKRVPVSEWRTPEEISEQLRAEGRIVPQLPPPVNRADVMPFIAAVAFSGAKPGYVFKNGELGLGYYLEGGAAAAARPSHMPPSASSRDVKADRSGGLVGSSSGASGGGQAADRNISRTVAGQVWKDKTLLDWPEDDFRVFIGDLGNEVNDDVLSHAFQKYPSFQMARVVRDRNSSKTKGYGFVSFKDPWDMTKALREMQGKYVGNRPIKIRKSTDQERKVTDTNQPLVFQHALGVSDKSTKRVLERGGAIHKKPTWKEQKKKKHLPW